jgi:hypothetical protein
MFPVLLEAARAAVPFASDQQLWKGTRFVTALVAFGGMFVAMRALTGSSFRARVGVVFAAYGYIWGPLTNEYDLPFDFLDMAFMSLFAWLALGERYAALFATVIVAAFNRESAAFAGVTVACIAFAKHGFSRRLLPAAAVAALLVAVAAAITLTLRYGLAAGYRGGQHVGLVDTLTNWRWALLPYGPGTAFLAMALPLGAALRAMPRPFSVAQRGLLLAALTCAAISGVFGIVYEMRVLLPSYVLAVFALVLGAAAERDEDWIARIVRGRIRTAAAAE